MSDPLDQIGQQFKADEFADKRAAEQRVEDFAQATATPAAPPTPEQIEKQQELAQANELAALMKDQLPMVCAIAWGMVDHAAVKYAGPQYKLTDEQREKLSRLTVPVLIKYIPADMSWFVSTPEGALLMAAVLIYAPKAMGIGTAPPPSSPPALPTPAAASPEAQA